MEVGLREDSVVVAVGQLEVNRPDIAVRTPALGGMMSALGGMTSGLGRQIGPG